MKGKFLLLLLSVYMILFLCNAAPAIAGTPHIIYGNVFNPDGTPPVKDNVDGYAYVLERPGEILSKSSVGCGYDIFQNGWLWFEAGNYIIPWAANEHLRIIIVDSILENTGVTDLILDSSGKQQISDLYLQSGDHVGPISSNALVDGLSYATIFEGTGSVTLTATLDDSISGNNNIQSVEYFIDSDPGYGSGTVMDPSDGSFNSPLEGVSALVNTSTWTRGSTHIIHVRGQDSAGNWGTAHHASVITVVPPCPQNGTVVCLDTNGNEQVFQSLQSAINTSGAGWKITVGPGTYNELVNISAKTDLIIKGCDRPTLNGEFKLIQARNIIIDGFDIIAGSGKNAITMLGGNNSSENITISNNFIHGADIEHSGISAARDNPELYIIDNHIYENGRNGVVFIDASGGMHYLRKNVIEYNGWNGVWVARDHNIILEENTISHNGTRTGTTGGRYGVIRERMTGTGNPQGITLINNTITCNNGPEIEGQSTKDLGNYDQMLDAADTGNVTGCQP